MHGLKWITYLYIYSTVYLVGGFNPSEKYEYEFVRLEKIIPTIRENKTHVPNHQADWNTLKYHGHWNP